MLQHYQAFLFMENGVTDVDVYFLCSPKNVLLTCGSLYYLCQTTALHTVLAFCILIGLYPSMP